MKDRIVYIDWLRIVAAVMVVMIHTSGMLLMHADLGSCAYWLAEVNGALVRSAVPLFFMISGALLLRPGYNPTPTKMVRKTAKVFALMLVWSAVYALLDVHPMTLKSFVFATWKGPFHFWFFEYLIGLYLLTPLLKAIVEYKEGLLVRFYLILFVIFGIGVESLQAIPVCHKWIVDITSKVHVEMMSFCGYFILGYYLSIHKWKIPQWIPVVCFAGCVLFHLLLVTHTTMLWNTDNWWVLTFMECICVWLSFGVAHLRMGGGMMESASSLMMGLYILHPLILTRIPEVWWTGWLYIADVFIVIGGALLLTWVLSKIPYIGKWLTTV